MDNKGTINENVFLLSLLVGDKDRERSIISGYDDQSDFLDYLSDNGVLSKGVSETDVYSGDTPDAVWIDPLIKEYYVYRRAAFEDSFGNAV